MHLWHRCHKTITGLASRRSQTTVLGEVEWEQHCVVGWQTHVADELIRSTIVTRVQRAITLATEMPPSCVLAFVMVDH